MDAVIWIPLLMDAFKRVTFDYCLGYRFSLAARHHEKRKFRTRLKGSGTLIQVKDIGRCTFKRKGADELVPIFDHNTNNF